MSNVLSPTLNTLLTTGYLKPFPGETKYRKILMASTINPKDLIIKRQMNGYLDFYLLIPIESEHSEELIYPIAMNSEIASNVCFVGCSPYYIENSDNASVVDRSLNKIKNEYEKLNRTIKFVFCDQFNKPIEDSKLAAFFAQKVFGKYFEADALKGNAYFVN